MQKLAPLPATGQLVSPGPSLARPVVLALAAVYAIWSSTYLALRVVVEHVPPMLAGAARFSAAGLVLLAVARARGERMPTARTWAKAAPVGVLLFTLGNGLVATAERTASSGAAAIACATMPLWAAGLSLAFGERPSRRDWCGLAVGFAGVVLLCAGSELRGDGLATAFLVLAPVSWALGSVLARRFQAEPGLATSAAQMIAGAVACLALALASGERVPAHVPPRALLALAYLVVFGSLVGYTAYAYLLRKARPTVAMSYAYVNPALAVLLGAAAYGETPTAGTLAATGLVVAGVAVAVRR